jgi:hypothetical protein
MKIDASRRGGATITINPRLNGEGLVVNQGTSRLLLSRDEWLEIRQVADGIFRGFDSDTAATPAKARYRMA